MAQTKIMYREKELMQLIHDHLVNKGEASQSEPVSRSVSQLYRHLVNKGEANRSVRASQLYCHLVSKGEASQLVRASQSTNQSVILSSWSIMVRPVSQLVGYTAIWSITVRPVSQSVILPSGQ